MISMKNNKGFSLIELMVVISISSILMIGAASGIRILTLANTNKIAQTIDSALDRNRIITMSKGSYHYIVIYWVSAKQEYLMDTITSATELDASSWSSVAPESSKTLASKEVLISYKNSGSLTTISVRDQALLIRNDPSTGGFKSSCSNISITSKGITKTINLVAKTGNHYIE